MSCLQRLIAFDRQTSARLAISQEARFLRLVALIIAHSGDSPLWLVIGAAAIIWGDATWRPLGWRMLIGTLVAGGVTTVLKWLFQRGRPPGKGLAFYTRLDRHSFPSGHAGRAACIALLAAPLLSPWESVLLASWVALVGVARVALQVHFPSDILGGWAAGLAVGLLLLPAF